MAKACQKEAVKNEAQKKIDDAKRAAEQAQKDKDGKKRKRRRMPETPLPLLATVLKN